MGSSALVERTSFHFRRQAPHDGYIVDFMCLKHRLIIEIDGGQHNFDAHARRDANRDNHFVNQGFTVLRFWNNDVDQNLAGVLEVIDATLRSPTRPRFARPPSPSGRD